MAKGSLAELETQIDIAHRIGYLDTTEYVWSTRSSRKPSSSAVSPPSPFSPTPTSASCPAGSMSPPSATSGGSAAVSTFFLSRPGNRRLLPPQRRRPGRLVLPDPDGLRGRHLQDHAARDRYQRHSLPPRGGARPGRPPEHGEDRRLLPGGRGGHPLQRLGDRGEKAHGNGRGNRHPRPLCETLVGTGEAGILSCPRPFLVPLLPESGEAEGQQGRK
ncbi:MAG: hypothetical protein CO013_07625 [Syntrophobacterales bacterium CG_4_8_14_3_um_filter_58_8]|nr:MAG: hypothetical protein CO013_07625 [Syntrophobacterales bacterium CG_4_8_14_3_um_filter_58_8]